MTINITPLRTVAPNAFKASITNRNKPLCGPAHQHIQRCETKRFKSKEPIAAHFLREAPREYSDIEFQLF